MNSVGSTSIPKKLMSLRDNSAASVLSVATSVRTAAAAALGLLVGFSMLVGLAATQDGFAKSHAIYAGRRAKPGAKIIAFLAWPLALQLNLLAVQ